MPKVEDEKLIRMVNVTRKLLSCDLDNQLKVVPQLAAIFSTAEVPVSLMSIIVTGLSQRSVYERIPNSVYDSIQSVLPPDELLNLQDSVYESCLVETPEDSSADQQANTEKQTLPLTLLRVPTDPQCHIFHYLNINDLRRVQEVCRALCIAARNPWAVYSLQINPNFMCDMNRFSREWLSRPKVLSIIREYQMIDRNRPESTQSIIGNVKWSESITEFQLNVCLWDTGIDMRNLVANLVPFCKLEKCNISSSSILIRNGQIASHHTLKELTLEYIMLTEDVIDEIRKFQNLEKLSLKHIRPNPDCLQHSDPISLPKLKLFDYGINNGGFREFQMFLIGSNPETVFNIRPNGMNSIFNQQMGDTAFITKHPIHREYPIKEFNVFANSPLFFETMTLWLNSAPYSASKLFDQINVHLKIYDIWRKLGNYLNPFVPSIATVFPYANRSKLVLDCDTTSWSKADCDMDEVVNAIMNAPYGAFTDVSLNIRFELLWDTAWDENVFYIEHLLESMDDDECAERDNTIVWNVLNEGINDLEQWFKPWLLFNEKRMKEIGLEKLSICYVCGLEPNYDSLIDFLQDNEMEEVWDGEMQSKADRCDRAFKNVIGECMKERESCWNKIGHKGVHFVGEDWGYSLTLGM